MFYIKLYLALLFFAFGAVLGSFLNCAAMRYAAGEKLPRGRSRCPKCGRTLGAGELVPVFSWLLLRGRCRGCHEKISPRYPLTELIGGGAYMAAYLRFGLSLYTAELAALLAVLLLLALIDYDTMTLPGPPMLAALIAWAAFLPTHADLKTRAVEGILTAAAVFAVILALSLVMDKLLKRESLGGGDLKLLALAALYLGPWGTLLMLIVSCALALLFAAVTGARERAFPFGPSICAGTALTLLFGGPVIGWYTGLLSI